MLPQWLNKQEFPFTSKFAEIDGHSIHYVDEGSGPTVLMVHGTPVWSFLYRHLIKSLSSKYRCIALDHLGFGLSDKPQNADYTPKAHNERLEKLINVLRLKDITLIVQDFGGPIGLGYAVKYPESIKQLVISNTWMWGLKGIKAFETAETFFGGAIGKWLYLNYGFSPKFMLPAAYGDKRKLTKEIHRHYLSPLNNKQNRVATYPLVKAMMGSQEYYESLWQRRDVLACKPTLVLWGMKDKFLQAKLLLPQWKLGFPQAQVLELPDTGHFIEEEAPETVAAEIEKFMTHL